MSRTETMASALIVFSSRKLAERPKQMIDRASLLAEIRGNIAARKLQSKASKSVLSAHVSCTANGNDCGIAQLAAEKMLLRTRVCKQNFDNTQARSSGNGSIARPAGHSTQVPPALAW